MTAVLELANVRFRWEGQARALLDVASLVVAAGEKLLLRGPSGSGKTTLLSLMAGVAAPSEGEVRLLGEEMGRLGLGRRDRMRADHIGYVFQLFNLVPYLTARENILLALRFSPLRRRRLAEAGKLGESEAGRLASGLGLDAALLDRPPTALSVGQQQRVACARALIGSPELVLADEPTSALDEEAREAFLKLLFSECEEAGTALLVVSHDRDLVRLFDRVVEMAALTGAKG